MGSADGAAKVAAKRVGLTLAEYNVRVANGQKWCSGCKVWHDRGAFGSDATRGDGLSAQCHRQRRTDRAIRYVPRQRTSKLGAFFVAPRDGDKLQARARVNHAVQTGLLAPPNNIACSDCGHEHGADGKRHEYDHHAGYSVAHQLTVQAVCISCHRKRDAARRRRCKNGREDKN